MNKLRYRKQRNYGCRIHDEYTYKGMRVIILENEKIKVSVLADKGTEIYEYLYKPKDIDLMWLTENGVQNPNEYLSTSSDPISAFIDYYPGGWQEIFPNGGPTSTYKGAQFGQHGEVAHMPWDYVITEDTPEKIQVEFTVVTKKVPFRIIKKMTLHANSAKLIIEEEVENLSEEDLEVMWGHHLAYGRPFLSAEASEIRLPQGVKVIPNSEFSKGDGSRVRPNQGQPYDWPICKNYLGEDIDVSKLPAKNTPGDVLYLTNFPEGRYEILNSDLGISFQVEWDLTVFPYVWYWQEFGTQGYPWYGRNYNIGLEPFSSYPSSGLSEAVENGSTLKLKGKEKRSFTLSTQVKEV